MPQGRPFLKIRWDTPGQENGRRNPLQVTPGSRGATQASATAAETGQGRLMTALLFSGQRRQCFREVIGWVYVPPGCLLLHEEDLQWPVRNVDELRLRASASPTATLQAVKTNASAIRAMVLVMSTPGM